MRILAYAAALLCMASPAAALLITIEADDYAVGTELTTLGDGVLIRRFSAVGLDAPTFSAIHTISFPTSHLGDRVFSNENSDFYPSPVSADCILGFGPCNPGALLRSTSIRFDFLDGTNFFQIDGETNSDPHGVWAYDANGVLLATCDALQQGCSELLAPAGLFGPFSTRTTIASDSRNIRTVIVRALSGATRIDRAVYSVPEPGTLALFGVGLIGLLASHLRRTVFAFGSHT
jgi:hypothetical protein